MQYKIDYMKELELNTTINLIKDVYDEFNKSDYEDDEIDNFYSFIEEDTIKEKIDSGEMIILVARTTYNQIIGAIAVSAENQVELLFIDKKFQRKGIGTNLLKYAVNLCKYNDNCIQKIMVNSFLCSVEFYRKFGFKEVEDFDNIYKNIYFPMEFFIVEKELDNDKEKSKIQNDEIYEILTNFYSETDEENRLKISKKGNLEFITTTTYIDKYLCKGDKILEIGAGAGVYSNYYANQGYKVDAVELLDVNLEKLKKIKRNNLKIHKANATDLSKFDDNSFDITLCLGPMYHIFTEEEQNKAIQEAIRVTKPCGKIFFAYITNESVIINYFLREHHLIDQKHLLNEDYIVKNNPNEVFYVCTVQEFKNRMKNFNVRYLNNVATDGIASIINDDLEYLEDDEFEEWVKYHLATCERKDLIGYSSHALYICEKE